MSYTGCSGWPYVDLKMSGRTSILFAYHHMYHHFHHNTTMCAEHGRFFKGRITRQHHDLGKAFQKEILLTSLQRSWCMRTYTPRQGRNCQFKSLSNSTSWQNTWDSYIWTAEAKGSEDIYLQRLRPWDTCLRVTPIYILVHTIHLIWIGLFVLITLQACHKVSGGVGMWLGDESWGLDVSLRVLLLGDLCQLLW